MNDIQPISELSASPKSRRWLPTILRLLVAAILLTYLFWKKTIDPSQIYAALTQWQYFIPGVGFLALPIFTCAWRWQLLLRGQKIFIRYHNLLRLITVSYFFNTFIPGANGGDIFRLYQLAKKKHISTTAVTTSVVLDHFLGMPTLMLLVLIGVLFNLNVVGNAPEYLHFHYLVKTIGIIAGVSLLVFGGLLVGSLYLHSLTERFEQKIPGGRIIHKITAALAVYRQHSRLLCVVIAISLIMHLATLSAFYLFGQATEIEGLSPSQYLFLVFAGLSVNFIPVSPGGIGIGEWGFEAFFKMAPPFLIENGVRAATMMICYRAGTLFYGLIGGVLYLFGKHTIADDEVMVK